MFGVLMSILCTAKYRNVAFRVVQNIVMYEWLPTFLNQEIPKYNG